MTMEEPIRCPQCGAPARITERFRLGTDGPIEQVKIGCGNHHWLTPLAETLAGSDWGVLPTRQAPSAPSVWAKAARPHEPQR